MTAVPAVRSARAVRAVRAPRTGLAADLREHTRRAHENAEASPFVGALLDGRLPVCAYTALAVQNHEIYRCLERHSVLLRHDPVAGAVVFDELLRVPSLEADLAVLTGPGWMARVESDTVPATHRYVAHLDEVLADWPTAFVAHHYVRYLGDLSGGQILGRRLEQVYGEQVQAATSFYRFASIEKIKPFKDRYRSVLDTLGVGGFERTMLMDEAVTAFDLNRAVFDELADRFVVRVPTSAGTPDS